MYAAKAAAASLTPGGSPGNKYQEKLRMDLQFTPLNMAGKVCVCIVQ